MTAPILLRQLTTTIRAVVDHLSDDPVVFAMQVSRRMPGHVPRRLGRFLSCFTGPVAAAASAWLLGDTANASVKVRAATRSSLQSLVLGELALTLGDRETASRAAQMNAHTTAGSRLAARLEWHAGNMSEAVKVAPVGHMRDRLASELRTFQSDWTPSLIDKREESTSLRLDRADVLFALTNSLPHTQSGYTLRSHAVLNAVRESGLSILGVNRTGYPTSVGKPVLRDRVRVDGIDYLYDVPASLGRTLERRQDQQATFLVNAARSSRAQIIHTTTHFVNGLAAQSAAVELGLPWVYEVRGSLEDTWASSREMDVSDAQASERYRLFRAREAQVAAAADHVVTLGRTMAEDLIQRGVESSKILVAPNSVGRDILESDWCVDPSRVREELGLDTRGTWVGTAASIVDYEGLDILVDATAAAREAGSDVRLLVVGEGVELPALRMRALALGSAAVFTGRLPPLHARKHIQALDVFAVPRKDLNVCRKITPLKPVEAGGLGRAVVLSELPALTESLPPNAYCPVEPDSFEDLARVLTHLAANREERERLGHAARRYVEENRTWSSLGEAYRQMYTGLGVAMKGDG